MTTKKNLIDKKKDRAFRKDIYLLGTDADGTKYWLEAPKWDCGWYWGFGYVETYTNNNNPSKSKDIQNHQHIDSSFIGEVGDGNKYIHNIYDAPLLVCTTFTKDEGWELSELFEQFYFLKKAAENFGRGKCNISNTSAPDWTDTALCEKINQTLIPPVTARILEILSPVTDRV